MRSSSSPFLLSRDRRRRAAGGFTLVELLIVMAIVGLLAALAMAGYRHARVTGAEATTLAALHSINQAQFVYAQTCGDQRYSPTLAGLGVPAPGTGQAFLSPDLTLDPTSKAGYRFAMQGTPEEGVPGQACNGLTPVLTYRVTADPEIPGATGARFFGTNTDRVVYADTATFTEDMPERGAPGHGTEVK